MIKDKEFDNIITKIREHNACDKVNNITSWGSLMDAFFTPYGLEFMQKTGYPNVKTFRQHKQMIAMKGIYIDAGKLSFFNNKNVGLIGKCTAELKYSGCSNLNTVVVMNGAKANITARNYAVIKVYNLGGEVSIKKDITVRIL